MTITALPRQECAATVLGEPTNVLDIGGLRIVSDPTSDDPGPHGCTRTSLDWPRRRCSSVSGANFAPSGNARPQQVRAKPARPRTRIPAA